MRSTIPLPQIYRASVGIAQTGNVVELKIEKGCIVSYLGACILAPYLG